MVELAEWKIEDFRQRIRKLPDAQLIRYGKAARYMADPRNSADRKTVLDVHRVQLQECIAEWERRHPMLRTAIFRMCPWCARYLETFPVFHASQPLLIESLRHGFF